LTGASCSFPARSLHSFLPLSVRYMRTTYPILSILSRQRRRNSGRKWQSDRRNHCRDKDKELSGFGQFFLNRQQPVEDRSDHKRPRYPKKNGRRWPMKMVPSTKGKPTWTEVPCEERPNQGCPKVGHSVAPVRPTRARARGLSSTLSRPLLPLFEERERGRSRELLTRVTLFVTRSLLPSGTFGSFPSTTVPSATRNPAARQIGIKQRSNKAGAEHARAGQGPGDEHPADQGPQRKGGPSRQEPEPRPHRLRRRLHQT
jgi:hypothetical protein